MRFEEKTDDPVRNIMTRKESLVTVQEHATKEEIRTLLHAHELLQEKLTLHKNESCIFKRRYTAHQ